METGNEIIASNLKRLRLDLNLNQSELAELADTTPNTISRIESALIWPSKAMLVKLSKALRVNEAKLFQSPGIGPAITNTEILDRVAYSLRITQNVPNEILDLLYELKGEDLSTIKGVIEAHIEVKKIEREKRKIKS